MSDEALAAALDLLDGSDEGEASQSALTDDDRENLYKLLDDD
jgi:hypothetical protein